MYFGTGRCIRRKSTINPTQRYGKWSTGKWPSPKAAGNLGGALSSAWVQLLSLTNPGWPGWSPSFTELLQRLFLTPLSWLCNCFLFLFFPKIKVNGFIIKLFHPCSVSFPSDSGFLIERQRSGSQSAPTCHRFNCTRGFFCRRIEYKYSPSLPVLPFICSAEF